MLSASIKGISANSHIYLLSDDALGQYISLDTSKVVGSAYCIPIRLAVILAIGSYSSADIILFVGIITLSLGLIGSCFLVL